MPKTRPPYAAEFRQQIVDLVRAGRTPEDMAASHASGTRLPFAPTASHRRRNIRPWSGPGRTGTRLGRVRRSSANCIGSDRELGAA